MDAITSALATSAQDSLIANRASSLQGNLNGVSSNSSEDELMQVCKDFASYFVEEVLKEIKESLTDEEEEVDSSVASLRDFHMDSVIELVADEIVEQQGSSFTQMLYEQMKRNYNIPDAVEESGVQEEAQTDISAVAATE